jgi:hypothetical protein
VKCFRYFVRAETPAALASAAAGCPAETAWLIAPLEARDGAGLFRKYRVMFVGGRLYPLRLAISRHWKVHYFTADMAANPAHRAADAAFLADINVIGAKAVAALHRIRDALALDYGGVDFAVNGGGVFCSSRPTPPWRSIRRSPIRSGTIAVPSSAPSSPPCRRC